MLTYYRGYVIEHCIGGYRLAINPTVFYISYKYILDAIDLIIESKKPI